MDKKEIKNRMLREQYTNLKARGVPETDPRFKALLRIMEEQEVLPPRTTIGGLKFTAPRRQNGLS